MPMLLEIEVFDHLLLLIGYQPMDSIQHFGILIMPLDDQFAIMLSVISPWCTSDIILLHGIADHVDARADAKVLSNDIMIGCFNDASFIEERCCPTNNTIEVAAG